MFIRKVGSKPLKSLNIAIVSDYINHFSEDWYSVFSFENYFVCELSSSLKSLGNNVTVVLPFHKSLESSRKFKDITVVGGDEVVFPERDGREEKKAEIKFCKCMDINLLFIREPSLSDRDGFVNDPNNGLAYPDNLPRFANFARSALESLKVMPFKPDVIHVVGKLASISVIYLKTLYRYDNFFRKCKVVFTVPSSEGVPLFVVDQYPSLGLDWTYYRYEYLEFYGKINIVKGAIVFSDVTTFCSPSYVEEARREEFGKGMEGVIAQKLNEGKIRAVLPGVSSRFSPQNDGVLLKIGASYSKSEMENKKKVKSILCKRYKLSEEDIMFLFMGEFRENTGISLVYEIFSEILPKGRVSLLVVGKGDEFRESTINELVSGNRGRAVWLRDINPDEITLHIAGADVILIPSIMEASTILPMVAMNYGTLPLVRGGGILNDVVRDKINGFKFYEYSPTEFRFKVLEAMEIFNKNPKRWKKLVETAMRSSISWTDVAKTYVEEVYSETKK